MRRLCLKTVLNASETSNKFSNKDKLIITDAIKTNTHATTISVENATKRNLKTTGPKETETDSQYFTYMINDYI